MNDEDTNNNIPEIVFPKAKTNYTQESLVEKIKDSVSSSCYIGKGAFKLRVRRNYVFKNSGDKMESP